MSKKEEENDPLLSKVGKITHNRYSNLASCAIAAFIVGTMAHCAVLAIRYMPFAAVSFANTVPYVIAAFALCAAVSIGVVYSTRKMNSQRKELDRSENSVDRSAHVLLGKDFNDLAVKRVTAQKGLNIAQDGNMVDTKDPKEAGLCGAKMVLTEAKNPGVALDGASVSMMCQHVNQR